VAAERLAAAEWLGDHQTADGAGALVAALGDSEAAVQDAIVRALSRFVQPGLIGQLVAATQLDDAGKRGGAQRVLLELARLQPQSVLAAVGDQDARIRRWAVATLGEQAQPEAVPVLLARLSDRDEAVDVRKEAAQALGLFDPELTIGRLLETLLTEPPADVRIAIIQALSHLGDVRAVPALIARLQSDSDARTAVIRALGVLSEAEAIPPLMALLEGGGPALRGQILEAIYRIVVEPAQRRNAFLRTARLRPLIQTAALQRELVSGIGPNNAYAAHILGWLARPDVIPDLVECLNSTDTLLRDAALESLLRFNLVAAPKLVEALERPEPAIRERAADLLGMVGDPSVSAPLFRHLNDEPSSVRVAVLRALAGLGGESAYAGLLLALNEPSLTDTAVTLISAYTDDALVDDFKRYLQSVLYQSRADEAIKWSAARALSMLGDEMAASILLNAIRQNDPKLRTAAANALSLVRGRRAVNVLIEATGDRDWLVRQKAIEALSNISDSRTITALMPLAADPDWRVRLVLVAALGRIRDSRVYGPLRKLAADGDPWVRRAVMAACARLDDPRARDMLLVGVSDRVGSVRAAAYLALSAQPDVSVRSVFRAGLVDAETLVRLHAMRALITLGAVSPEDVALLRPLAHDRATEVRAGLAEALGELAADEAVALLEVLVTDPELSVRERAVEALGHIGSPVAVQALISGLDDPDLEPRVGQALADQVDLSLRAPLLAARSPDAAERRRAARGLRHLPAQHAGPALEKLRRDPDHAVRQEAGAV
jgi:HEAT repeat protein